MINNQREKQIYTHLGKSSMEAVQSVDYSILYGKTVQNKLAPQSTTSASSVKEQDSLNNIGLLTAQTDLEKMKTAMHC